MTRTPSVASKRRRLDVNVDGTPLRFVTDSGVFSPQRLDPGTRLLLSEMPPLRTDDRQVLDLGCGWGAIACVLALRHAAAANVADVNVVAVDTNKRALRLTAHNAALNGVDNVTAALPASVDPTTRFDRILSNPPIRIGKHRLHEMLVDWLDRLAPSGLAHLVVNRHLGADSLARWLREQQYGVDRLLSRGGYRILEIQPR